MFVVLLAISLRLRLPQEFLRPIVTPFELFLALRAEPFWPGSYILDFERVINLQTSRNSEDCM